MNFLTEKVKQCLPPSVAHYIKKIKHNYINKDTGVRLYYRLEKLLKDNPKINALFPYEDMIKHYVYEPARQTKEYPDIYVNQTRFYRIYQFLKERFPEVFLPETLVADIGDTSGALLKVMQCRGLSVNINPDVVAYIREAGFKAEVGDVEDLPFADKSFDYVFCFECIEHVANPIRALRELSRVTRNLIFLSIPYVERTRIYNSDYWHDLKGRGVAEGGWNEQEVRDVDGHKFEFSTKDFKNVITHAQLRYVDNFPINYFMPLGLKRRNEGSYFNFFILRPEDKRRGL